MEWPERKRVALVLRHKVKIAAGLGGFAEMLMA
jgi:hypothetical protein